MAGRGIAWTPLLVGGASHLKGIAANTIGSLLTQTHKVTHSNLRERKVFGNQIPLAPTQGK